MEQKDNKPAPLTRRAFIGRTAALSAFMIVPRYVLGGRGFTAPSDRLALGFIGNGRQGHGLLHSFLQTGQVQVLANCDVYTAKREHFKNQVDAFYAKQSGQNGYKGCTAYNDFRELLGRKDIDAVVVASPDFWHSVHVVYAAEAGKDIYGEKPLSLTVREGRAMVNAVRKHKRIFQTGSMQRSWPEFRQTVELVRNGYIGDIRTVKVSVGGPPVPYDLQGEPLPAGLDWNFWLGPDEHYPYNNRIAPALDANFWAEWRKYREFGGGDMTDWGAHMFDIVQWALDKDSSGPVDIIPPDGKDHPFLTYRYDNGITVTHEDFGKAHAVRFIGSKGQIDIRRHKLETTPDSLKDKVIGPDEKRVYKSENHYTNWLDAIRKRSLPVCDIETGHRSATVCNLGNIAYAVKRPLKWDPVKETFKNDPDADKLLGRKMRKEWDRGQR
ncbi:Gfo/Idh/MocA family oxidoreductase [Compostibacter hankyongensis]|uniref:Gfo/Idh/MocA family oxidoreductase n=1 Tax=Compostibacter hankyongensis TaxID=1007089 RepID=A0ABP8FK99_9BACT